jgi:hypothetical protein
LTRRFTSCLVSAAFAAFAATVLASPATQGGYWRRVEYRDLPHTIQRRWSTASAFERFLRGVDDDTRRRVADGEREHLIYYALQSNRFTSRRRIEPAISSQQFVAKLSEDDRRRLLDDDSFLPAAGWPQAERARIDDLLAALEKHPSDVRLAYFRQLLSPDGARLPSAEALYRDYVRVARFLYRKEFLDRGAEATSELYRSRAHSSDTQIEAGFGVYSGLGTLHALDSGLRVRDVLIVGPGLDWAPRTDLIDAVPPQSYQPFAVADALLTLSLASESDLRIHSVDVNPRVVEYVRRAAGERVTLHFFTAIGETPNRRFTDDYKAYVDRLGRAIGSEATASRGVAADARYAHSIAVRPAIARAMNADVTNIITERLTTPAYDLVIATNVLTYFDDSQLALALANIGAMLRPGGHMLHNESRAWLAELAAAVGIPILQMRTVVLARPTGPPGQPLYDAVWLHQKSRTP